MELIITIFICYIFVNVFANYSAWCLQNKAIFGVMISKHSTADYRDYRESKTQLSKKITKKSSSYGKFTVKNSNGVPCQSSGGLRFAAIAEINNNYISKEYRLAWGNDKFLATPLGNISPLSMHWPNIQEDLTVRAKFLAASKIMAEYFDTSKYTAEKVYVGINHSPITCDRSKQYIDNIQYSKVIVKNVFAAQHEGTSSNACNYSSFLSLKSWGHVTLADDGHSMDWCMFYFPKFLPTTCNNKENICTYGCYDPSVEQNTLISRKIIYCLLTYSKYPSNVNQPTLSVALACLPLMIADSVALRFRYNQKEIGKCNLLQVENQELTRVHYPGLLVTDDICSKENALFYALYFFNFVVDAFYMKTPSCDGISHLIIILAILLLALYPRLLKTCPIENKRSTGMGLTWRPTSFRMNARLLLTLFCISSVRYLSVSAWSTTLMWSTLQVHSQIDSNWNSFGNLYPCCWCAWFGDYSINWGGLTHTGYFPRISVNINFPETGAYFFTAAGDDYAELWFDGVFFYHHDMSCPPVVVLMVTAGVHNLQAQLTNADGYSGMGVTVERPTGNAPASCLPGYYCQLWLKSNGLWCSASGVAPVPCTAGYYCPYSSVAPSADLNGYYCGGANTRTSCPEGSYCPTGSDITVICPSGSYCPVNSGAAVLCSPGYYCPNAGLSSQLSCSAGYYTSSPGATSCLTCPAGTNTGAASSACTFAPTGQPSGQPSGQPTSLPTAQPSRRTICLQYGIYLNFSVPLNDFQVALAAAIPQILFSYQCYSIYVQRSGQPEDNLCARAIALPPDETRHDYKGIISSHRNTEESLAAATDQIVIFNVVIASSDMSITSMSSEYQSVITIIDNSMNTGLFPYTLIAMVDKYNLTNLIPMKSALALIHPYYTHYPTGQPTGQPSGQPTSQPTLEPPPYLTMAKFENSGAGFNITFDMATDEANITAVIWPCSQLFAFPGMSFCTCSWLSPSLVKVTIPYLAGIIVAGDVILLNNGSIRRQCTTGAQTCSHYLTSDRKAVSIQNPSNPVIPTVHLSSSSMISSCDDIIIDATGTRGTANRAWEHVQWDVRIDVGLSNYTGLIAVLNSNGLDITVPITLPNKYLSHGQLTVSLTVTNYFNKSTSGSISVLITTDRNVPSVTILGQIASSLLPYQVISVESLGQVSSCADSPVLSYEWIVTDASGTIVSDTLSQSVNVHVWRNLPYILLPYSNYTLTSVVRSFNYESQSNTSIQLVTTSGVVRAIIAGASVRDAVVNAALIIDGSSSYDENYSYNFSSLHFTWYCSFIDEGSTNRTDCTPLISDQENRPVLNITLLPLALRSYTFLLTCTQPKDNRFSNTSVQVQSIAPSVPLITLLSNNLLASPGMLANIETRILARVPVHAAWRDAGAMGIDLFTVNRSQILRDFTVSDCTSNIPYNLVVDTSNLTPGKMYTFELRATSLVDSSASSAATITMLMRLPPSSGFVTVSPVTGFATSTVFTMLAFGWLADGGAYPLSYDYRYQLAGDMTYQVLQLKIVKSFMRTTLPAGYISENNTVNLLLRVYDSYSSQASTSTSVLVIEETAIDIPKYFTANLRNTTLSLDYHATLRVLNYVGTLYTLNACVGAPDCTTLNRAPCVSSSTPQSCGSCLTGYFGVEGSSNTLCHLEALSFPGDSCISSSDCLFANCMNRTCAAVNKTCSTSIPDLVCSGHGSCDMVDSYGSPLLYCAPKNVSCNAACGCSPGFSGYSCNTTVSDTSLREQSVNLICSTALLLLDSFDPSPELMEGLFSTMDLAYNSFQINSSDALLSCLLSSVNISRVAIDFMSISQSGLVTVKRAYTLLSSLSLSTSRLIGGSNISDASNNPYSPQINSYLSHISTSVLNQLLPGQSPVHVVTSNVQISLHNSFVNDVSNTVLSSSSAGTAGAFLLDGGGLRDCEAYSNGFASFAVSQFNSIPFPQSGDTKGPLTRWYSAAPPNTTGTTKSVAPYYVRLPFFNAQDLTPHFNRFFNSTLPECVTRVGENYGNCPDCIISSYTNSYATFKCISISNLCPSAGSALGDGVGSTRQSAQSPRGSGDSRVTLRDYSVLVNSLEAEILSVFGAQGINWATAGEVVAIVAILTFIYICGAIYFTRWDILDRKVLTYAYVLPNPMKEVTGAQIKTLRSRVNTMFLSGVGTLQKEFVDLNDADHEFDQRKLAMCNVFYPIRALYNEVFKIPKILADKINLLERNIPAVAFVHGILRFHPFLSFYFGPSMVKTRLLRWTSFFKSLLISLFTSTLIFGIYYPFNETCSTQISEAACLLAPSKLASGQTECTWEVNYDVGYSKCSLRPPPDTASFIIFVAVITSLISLPFDLVISYLLLRVCNRAPDFAMLSLPSMFSFTVNNPAPEDLRLSFALERDNMRRLSFKTTKEDSAISYFMRTLRSFILEWNEGRLADYQIENMIALCGRLGIILENGSMRPNRWHAFRGRTVKDIAEIYILDAIQRGETLFKEIIDVTETLHMNTRDNNQKRLYKDNIKDTLLLHRFVNEMIGTVSKSILGSHLDDYNRTFPSPIHPLKWLLAWVVVIGLMLFFVIWILLWGVQNTGLAVSNWMVNFIIETLYGCLVSSTLRILAVHLLLMSWIRPKIRQTTDRICKLAESLDNDAIPDGQTYLFQTISAVCYAAKTLNERSDELSLPAVIGKLSDEDIALFRDTRPQKLLGPKENEFDIFADNELEEDEPSYYGVQMKAKGTRGGVLRESAEYLIEL